MKLYLNAVMKQKTEEEKYSVFLFIIGEKEREIFNTWTREKKLVEKNQPIDEVDITIKLLMERFKADCLQKSTTRRNNKWLHHRIEELIIDL